MELLNRIVSTIALGLSRLLDPAMPPLERLDLFLRQQLTVLHVAYEWQVITAGWVIVLFLVFRALRGAARIIYVLLLAAVLMKIYGVLPIA